MKERNLEEGSSHVIAMKILGRLYFKLLSLLGNKPSSICLGTQQKLLLQLGSHQHQGELVQELQLNTVARFLDQVINGILKDWIWYNLELRKYLIQYHTGKRTSKDSIVVIFNSKWIIKETSSSVQGKGGFRLGLLICTYHQS